jgi:hypothetical protein
MAYSRSLQNLRQLSFFNVFIFGAYMNGGVTRHVILGRRHARRVAGMAVRRAAQGGQTLSSRAGDGYRWIRLLWLISARMLCIISGGRGNDQTKARFGVPPLNNHRCVPLFW